MITVHIMGIVRRPDLRSVQLYLRRFWGLLVGLFSEGAFPPYTYNLEGSPFLSYVGYSFKSSLLLGSPLDT